MSRTAEIVTRARAAQRPELLCEAIPFAKFLGLEPSLSDTDGLTFCLPYSEHLIGNPGVPALHGGTLSSLLETVAVMMTLWTVEPIPQTRVITVTTDYLRPALLEDVFAAGKFLRVGRRFAAVEVRIWQGEQRLVARGRVHVMIRR